MEALTYTWADRADFIERFDGPDSKAAKVIHRLIIEVNEQLERFKP
jgi:hypothetical protein